MAEDSQQSLTDFGSAGADDDGSPDEGTEAEIAEAVAGNGGGDSTAVVDMAERRYPDAEGTTTLAVTQVDYTVEGHGDEERPVLHVFGRNAERESVHVRVHEFEPYFYAPLSNFVTDAAAAEMDPSEWTEDDLDPMQDPEQQFDRLTGRHLTDADGEPFESIRGERLLKITGQTPRDVGQLRDRFDHYEADILFPNRLLIDRDIRSGVRVPIRREEDGDGAPDGAGDGDVPIDVHHSELEPVEMDVEPRVCTFDIEVDDRRGFPEDGEEPIVCLTSHDSYDDEYVVWLYTAPEGIEGPDALPGYEPIEDDLDVEVRSFEREETMLAEFVDYIRETDPDVLTGWNFTDFDAPYLLDRIEELATPENGLAIDPTSRVNEVWRSDWQGPNVKGRVVFDLLYAYKRTQFTELDSYRLDAVGETELDVGKERYAGDIGDLWEEDPERLLEYNLRDVELCVELDRKQEIVPFWQEVASFVGCKLEDATTPGDAVDMYILHEVFGDFVLPSKGTVDAEDYEGGAVFDPITGVKENVSVLDLKSLYPMSMVTINASPETKVGPDYDGETYRAPNGTLFRKEPDGIIRTMVDDLLTEREEKKVLRNDHEPGTDPYEQYDRQQQAVKVIMNSLYGVLGWDRFRLYDKEMGAAVTATGRDVIRYTERVVSEMDYQIVYGDTDSVMLELGQDVSTEEAIEQSFEIEERVNESYDEFAREDLNAEEHRFQIEFEKLYRRFFQAGKKKRYAGHIVWKEGKDVDDIDITGFEYKRSDIAPVTKRVQHRVIEMIVTGADLEDVRTYVHEEIDSFKAGNVDYDDIGIPGGIGKKLDAYDTATAQVRGAKYANLLLGTNFGRGSKPKRLYLENVDASFFERMEEEEGLDPHADPLYGEFKRDPDVICFEFADQVPEEFHVDYEKMLEKTLKGPIARILEALDISWQEVESGQEQTGLGSFM
ncbi:DNA-directed DNA polymerase [Haloglomus litoreum]|uniref:DNA-directed DNA polymerase n=1 Tax=Haloglomus litoreum TaxID=3034026 RepID=UPI0023E7B277|nr:DNA-directed DNA polymerase [Haloglomus sp. DT116]